MAVAVFSAATKELSRWLHQHTNDKDFPKNPRVATTLAIFQNTMDIADAITILVESKLPGPAFSLSRPMFEGLVRGHWLLLCSSDAEIESFNIGNCPRFPALLAAIGSDAESGAAWIQTSAKMNLKSFHDLTHGGSEHVRRRLTSNAIEANYPENEVEHLLKMGIEVRIRIGSELFLLLKNEAAMKDLGRRAKILRALK